VELTIDEDGKRQVVVFTGDLGPADMPILKDPVRLSQADWVFMESTYGDHDHRPLAATVEEFHTLIREAIARKGKVLVPTFALGRTQQILYYLTQAFAQGVVPPFPVYIDSPLGIAATEVYARHPELYDEDMREFISGTKYNAAIKTIQFSQTADESKALNDISGPCLIMAGSGMCTAGRILHHLKHNLWKELTTVIFVGYQAPGSLGRLLIDGREQVSIYGEKIAVRATIRSLGGFSAHAGQSDLLKWYGALAPSRPRTVLIHGEDRARKPLARLIEERWGIEATLPCTGDVLQ
jgi:metallo-beta-lactamase family protein